MKRQAVVDNEVKVETFYQSYDWSPHGDRSSIGFGQAETIESIGGRSRSNRPGNRIAGRRLVMQLWKLYWTESGVERFKEARKDAHPAISIPVDSRLGAIPIEIVGPGAVTQLPG